MEIKRKKEFGNGCIYLMKTEDNYPVEVTDTFLPSYTKDCLFTHSNKLNNSDLGSRKERWMVGISCMSGCPIHCKFCATGKLKKWRNLSLYEMIQQIMMVTWKNKDILPRDSMEFKINYTRMGEPFLNINNIRNTIEYINYYYPNTHHYISTIGIKDSDFSWIEGNITLQISVHSLLEEKRNWLIPYKNKMSLKELGQIRTRSNLKTTINLTLVDNSDFNIELLKEYFDPKYFFIKLSPINTNEVSNKNNLGKGIIEGINLI